MPRFEVKKRDGLARISLLTLDEKSIPLPEVVETADIFPDLANRSLSNIPLSAPREFAEAWFSPGTGQPVGVHPALENRIASGDCVIIPGIHTALSSPRDFVAWLVTEKEHIPPDTAWYAPGAALPSTVHILVYAGFDLFDFAAVDLMTARHRFCLPEGEFPEDAMAEGMCTCGSCCDGDLGGHNRQALSRELALLRKAIATQQLRELVESRCRLKAEHVAILRHFDRQYCLLEAFTPAVRDARLGAMTGDAQTRPEIRRFSGRVLDRYVPPAGDVAVLLPCSARKPYSLSRSHRKFTSAIAGRAVELIVTSPLGLVPRELERIYPAAHYDIPVTGHWDREELSFAADILAGYFTRHPCRRVLAHLDGGALEAARIAADKAGITLEETCRDRPTSPGSLENLAAALDGERTIRHDVVRGTLSWQFGMTVDTKGMEYRWKPPELSVRKGKEYLFSLDHGTGLLRPTFSGWKYLPGVYRVQIDNFPVQGDVLAPGVISADPEIREADEVLVEGAGVTATGRAAMPGQEMEASSRGVAVRVRKVSRRG